MGWCPAAASADGLAIPASRRARSSRPTMCGRADYKGQFRTGDGRYCYPLTVADGFSRYLLGCQALSSTAVAGGEAGLHPAVPGVRAAAAHPQRQRRAVRHEHAGALVDAVGVVGPPGHPAGADRARAPGAERPARTDAPHPEGRDHAPRGGQPGAPSSAASTSFARSSTTSGPHEALDQADAGGVLHRVAAADAGPAAAARVPGSLRSPLRQRQRRHPLERALGERLDRVCRASTSGWRRLPTGSGTSTLGRCRLGRLQRAPHADRRRVRPTLPLTAEGQA